MSRIKFEYSYKDIVSLENLLDAWKEFLNGKRSRKDVQEFEQNLMHNIISLHNDLIHKTYVHSPYEAFNISDPKPRNIHKAAVRDRLLHHAIYRFLYPFFDRVFVEQSFSCRFNKGTHKALNLFTEYTYKVSQNNTKTCWVLKCDIRKFFATIDQKILIEIIKSYIPDKDIVWLLSQIIGSFNAGRIEVGLPLGNLTSQLLVNLYMNEFDQFVKHKLKAKYYIRYADDFVIISGSQEWLENSLPRLSDFLWTRLRLELHPKKISLKTLASGVDFLGWVNFPSHRVLRSVTKRRVLRGVRKNGNNSQTVQSYLGLISHGNTKKLHNQLEELIDL